MDSFSRKAIEQLKWYVYLYLDPRDDKVFYVGKGRGNRAFSHLKDAADSEKTRRLGEMAKLGVKPKIEILKYGMSEDQAFVVESAVIDLLGVNALTNRVRGHRAAFGNRDSVSEIASILDAPDIKITDPCLLININQSYRPGMPMQQLYDLTRSAWKVGVKRESIDLVLSVFRGVVREVFQVAAWVPDGTTLRAIDEGMRKEENESVRKRWEFVGTVAPEKIRRRYLGKSVARYFPQGSQNPLRYVDA